MLTNFFKLLKWPIITLFIVSILLTASAIIYKGFSGKSTNPGSDTWPKHNISTIDSKAVSTHLQKIEKLCKTQGTTALFVVYNQKVLFQFGDVKRNTPVHSIRKSLLSGLIGIYADNEIDITKTIGELKITDLQELSETEKTATVQHLLLAQSGVYHPAALEPRQMQIDRPTRNSRKPGEFWFYNNWDFNVLGTIFNQQTRKDLFAAFYEDIAKPTGMEDFNLKCCKYVFEREKSIHPGYVFKMSARDLARFGQLYLNNGQWNGKQVIPVEWIEESTKAYYKNENFGYGYMWWVHGGEYEQYHGFNASGMYGNRIDVVPVLNLVIVHRVNSVIPYRPFINPVDWYNYEKILKEIINLTTILQNEYKLE